MKISVLPALLSLLAFTTAQAETIFEESFNAAQDPRGLLQWQGNKNLASESDGAWMEVVPDEDNLFGEGTDNRVFVLHDRSDSSSVNLYAKLKGADAVVTLSLDFVEPPGSVAGPAVIRIGTGRNEASELAVNLAVRDGSLEHGPENVYRVGEKQRLTIVANNSTETVTYGGTSLPSQHYDVYVNKEHVLNARSFNTEDGNLPVGGSLDALRLLTYIGVTKDQTFQIDNVSVKNGLPQVEPLILNP